MWTLEKVMEVVKVSEGEGIKEKGKQVTRVLESFCAEMGGRSSSKGDVRRAVAELGEWLRGPGPGCQWVGRGEEFKSAAHRVTG